MTTSTSRGLFTWTTLLIICTIAINNLSISWKRIQSKGEIGPVTERQFSYVGNDYPDYYPMESLAEVLMTPEDSVHYSLSGPTAAAQWASNNPPGGGYVRLGEPKRVLCVSMFHQLHCLRYLRQALVTADDPYAGIPHSQHCLNYLRQLILCHPDLTLEDSRWRDHGWEPGKRGATHTCRDWGMVYEEMERNRGEWQRWSNTSHVTELSLV